MKKNFFKKAITMATATLMAVGTIAMCAVPAMAEDAEFDPSGATTYHAALGIQTCTKAWINRQAYYDDTNNKYANDPDMYGKLWAGDPSAEGSVYDGTFTDVEIKGNGTFTVKLEGADFSGETDISQLYIATDIPSNDKITVTDYEVKINGKTFVTFKDDVEFETEEKYMIGGLNVLCINHWRPELVEKLEGHGIVEDASNGYTLLKGTGNESIEMTFTIGGFDVDDPNGTVVEETTTAAPAETQAPTTAADTKADTTAENKGGFFPLPGIPIIAGVVVAVVVVVVVVSTKKKN